MTQTELSTKIIGTLTTGQNSADSKSFVPAGGFTIWLDFATGTAVGTAKLQVKREGDTAFHDTGDSWTANADDSIQELEDGAQYNLTFTGSGTLNYRLGQPLQKRWGFLRRVALASSSAIGLLIGGNAVSAANPVPTMPADCASQSASLTTTGVLWTLDTTGYSEVAVQVTSAGTTCTITYEHSADSVTWLAHQGYNPDSLGGSPGSTTNTAVSVLFQNCLRYFRARVSTYTSGTVTAFGQMRSSSAFVRAGSLGITGTVTANSPASTNTQNTLAMTGATQQVLAANATRKAWSIQNTSGVTLYVNVGAAASSSDGKSFQVAPGAMIGENGSGSVSTQAINALAASGSIAYSESN